MIYYVIGFVIGLSIYVVLLSFRILDLSHLEADIFKLEFRMDEFKAESKCIQETILRQLEEEKSRNERLLDYIRLSQHQKPQKKGSDKNSQSPKPR